MGLVALSIRWSMRALCVLFLVLAGDVFPGEGQMLRIPVREGVVVPVFWLPQESTASAPDAPATLVLLPGGNGTIGKLDESGWPASGNFLVRSGKLFAAHGFNLAMVAKPSDLVGLDPVLRGSRWHREDLHKVLAHLRQLSAAPLWLVATSQGTISAALLAIAESQSSGDSGGGLVAGVVLTSSITSNRIANTVPRLDLDRIRVPVLVMHHAQDACFACRADETANIVGGLTNAPVRKLLIVDGGGPPVGDPCAARHYHGYVGMEAQAVDAIAAWVGAPMP